ncbi:MAG: hypothetical protein HY821_17030 [Acidobacteria bacterium]|nr:hypothetical protein [Acidobacteriota bacterium]
MLYEMVTGRKAFQGKNYTSLVGAILAAEPAPMAVQPFTPRWLERLVQRCLAKDPEDRWQSMRDIVIELSLPPREAPGEAPARWPWMAAIAVLAIVAAAAWLRPGGGRVVFQRNDNIYSRRLNLRTRQFGGRSGIGSAGRGFDAGRPLPHRRVLRIAQWDHCMAPGQGCRVSGYRVRSERQTNQHLRPAFAIRLPQAVA